MKKIRNIFLLAAIAFGFSAKAQDATKPISETPIVEELVAKHIEAIGGADAWKKINTMKIEGTMTVMGNDVNVSMTKSHLKGFRTDISVSGMNGYSIITPTEGWNFMPFQGQTAPEAMPAEAVKEVQSELDAQGAFIDYKMKGTTIEYVGKDDVDGTECNKLKLTYTSGMVEYDLIDPKSNLIIRRLIKSKANGQEVDQVVNYSNYKKQPEGILIPMTVSQQFGELNMTKVSINSPIDDSVFKLPK